MLINCSVCLGDIYLLDKDVSILNCGHFFHSQCLNDWLAQQMNCPECRAIVTIDNFVKTIFPKVNDETLSQWKSLYDKYKSLQNEMLRKKEECAALKNETVLLKMWNSTLKDSKLNIFALHEISNLRQFKLL